jgi:hypothetical protein
MLSRLAAEAIDPVLMTRTGHDRHHGDIAVRSPGLRGWCLITPFPIDDIPERPAVEIAAQIVAEEIDAAMTVLITCS